MMSGTSLDGVDVALIETDGIKVAGFWPNRYRPYSSSERILLRHGSGRGVGTHPSARRPAIMVDAEAMVTRARMARRSEKFLDANAAEPRRYRDCRFPRPDGAASAGRSN